MKIYLSNTQTTYDTESDTVQTGKRSINSLSPLHHCHNQTDWQYLAGHFPLDHAIFKGFPGNYYWSV